MRDGLRVQPKCRGLERRLGSLLKDEMRCASAIRVGTALKGALQSATCAVRALALPAKVSKGRAHTKPARTRPHGRQKRSRVDTFSL